MPKTNHLARSRWFWTFVLVSAFVVPAREVGAQSGSQKPRVKVVEIIKSGTPATLQAFPPLVKLKKKQDIVVWVTNGLSMDIQFKTNPFTDLKCYKGAFCGALIPPNVEGTFKYTVTVDGVVLDPNVEVVK